MEVLGLWSRSHEAHGLAMVVGLNRGLCRGWWVFGRGGGCLTALRLWVLNGKDVCVVIVRHALYGLCRGFCIHGGVG